MENRNLPDPMARGGVRRYLDTVHPEEYNPNTGEVDLSELSLTGLADLYGSDKGKLKHNYSVVYEKIISELLGNCYRKDACLNIVEYGIACGASLRMWANFLPNSSVYGVDVREECKLLCADLNNVHISICDITDKQSVDQLQIFKEQFDIIVDDASHISEDIAAAFNNTWRYLKSGGYYIIEDLKCTYNPAYLKNFRKNFNPNAINDRKVILSFMDFLMKSTDLRKNIREFHYYHELLVIKKI